MFFRTNEPQAGHTLSGDEMRLLRALKGRLGHRWVQGQDLCMSMLEVKKLHSFHIPEINALVATGRRLESRGLVQAKRTTGAINWDLKLTPSGRAAAGERQCGRFGPAVLALTLVAACTAVPKEPELPVYPHNSSKSSTIPKIIQTRDAAGNLQWTQCTENCPQATPKRQIGEAPPLPNLRLKNLPGAANSTKGNPSAVDVAPLQPSPGRVEELRTRTPEKTSAGTVQVPVEYSVFFRTGSATLTPGARTVVEALGQDALRATRIEIVGRADSGGQRVLNEILATKRANAIKAVLVGEGVEQQNIAVRQVVENAPASPSSTAIGSFPPTQVEQSRRADLTLVMLQLKKT